MYETDTLISTIQNYPSLWDINHDDYQNRELKDLAWEQVLKELCDDWEIIDDQEQQTRVSDTKKKWANIRDSYRKDHKRKKNTPSESRAKKKRRYVYANALSFLDPIFESKLCDGNRICKTETVKTSSEIKKQKQEIPNQILNIIKQKTKKTESDSDDDDSKFLLSFRSDMRDMTKKQKLDFKIGMLQLVAKITENRDTPSCSSSAWSSNPNTRYIFVPSPNHSSNQSIFPD